MALPKRRHSATRGKKRRTHWKAALPGLLGEDSSDAYVWVACDTSTTRTLAAYLRKEWHRTLNRVKTLDCHRGDCNVCGMQNFGAEQCALQVDELIQTRRAGKPLQEMIPLRVLV